MTYDHNNISLFFTIVIDELSLGTEEEDEQELVDRKYWEAKGSKESLKLADKILDLIKDFAGGFTLKYNKHYIGLSIDGVSKNFISFVPRKNAIILHAKHEQNEEIQALLDSSDFDILSYDRQWKQYRLRLKASDIESNKDVLVQLIEKAYHSYMS